MSADIGVLVYGGTENERNQLTQLIGNSLAESNFVNLEVEGGMDGFETTGSLLEYINDNNPGLIARRVLVSSAASIDEAAALEPLEADDDEENNND